MGEDMWATGKVSMSAVSEGFMMSEMAGIKCDGASKAFNSEEVWRDLSAPDRSEGLGRGFRVAGIRGGKLVMD